jgi:TPP-dependent trihydroxycyclohexane-1,2-dione (THcHDO) dehydratase
LAGKEHYVSYTIRIEERINSIERTVEVTGDEPQATLDVMRAVRVADEPTDWRSKCGEATLAWSQQVAALREELEAVKNLNAEQAYRLARRDPSTKKLADDLEACRQAAEALKARAEKAERELAELKPEGPPERS